MTSPDRDALAEARERGQCAMRAVRAKYQMAALSGRDLDRLPGGGDLDKALGDAYEAEVYPALRAQWEAEREARDLDLLERALRVLWSRWAAPGSGREMVWQMPDRTNPTDTAPVDARALLAAIKEGRER